MTAPPKRRMSGDERRETVLVVAVAEFARTGLQGTSTERIAAGAGISHPYLFRLFGTKKELFLACVDRCYSRLAELFTQAAEGAGEGDVVPEPQDQGSGESMDSAEKSADA